MSIVTPLSVIGSAGSIGRDAVAACWERSRVGEGWSWRLICAGVGELAVDVAGGVDVVVVAAAGLCRPQPASAMDRGGRGGKGSSWPGHAGAPGAVIP